MYRFLEYAPEKFIPILEIASVEPLPHRPRDMGSLAQTALQIITKDGKVHVVPPDFKEHVLRSLRGYVG